MKIKNLQYWLFIPLFLVVFGLSVQSVFAADYIKREIILEHVGDELVSPIFEEKELFNAIGIQTDQVIENLMVNFTPGNGDFWEPVEIHDDGFGPEALIFSRPTYAVQFKKLAKKPNDTTLTLRAHILFADTKLASKNQTENLYSGPAIGGAPLKIIKRRRWKADETMRYWKPDPNGNKSKNGKSEKSTSTPCAGYEKKYANEIGISHIVKKSSRGDQLSWPLQYAKKIHKIVVHHTDSEIRDVTGDNRMDSLDYKAIIRAIYHYHTITRGWGDIGYNYLIDPLGNIYEGRYGGDRVIGAHALCHNHGTVGIAIIGNYEVNNIPQPAQQSLTALIAQKAKQYKIDPTKSSSFRGKNVSNITGHRDLRPTACPGKKLYAMLPKIRERAGFIMRSSNLKESNVKVKVNVLEIDAKSLSSIPNFSLQPGEHKTLTIRFQNTGKIPWDQNSWLHVNTEQGIDSRIIPIIADKQFVAANIQERLVSSGNAASFEVDIEAGYTPGNFTFNVAPVVNGRYKVSRAAIAIPFMVKEPDFSYRIISQHLPGKVVFQGQKLTAWVELKNTGNVVWRNYGPHKITLGTESKRDRKSIFIKENPSRIGYLLQSEVRPGERGRFILPLEVPMRKKGKVTERFTPVIEGTRWLENKNLKFKTTIKKPVHKTKIKQKNKVTSLLPGEMRKIKIQMTNQGDVSWDRESMEVELKGRGIKVFKKRLIPQEIIKKNKKVNFDFWIQAPYRKGKYNIALRPKFNHRTIKGGTSRYAINVPKPILSANLITPTRRLVKMYPNRIKKIKMRFKNTGNVIWRNKGENIVYLAPNLPPGRMSALYYPKKWVNRKLAAKLKETEVKPGEIGTFTLEIQPKRAGIFRENFQPFIENVGWVRAKEARWNFRIMNKKTKKSINSKNSKSNIKKKKTSTKLKKIIIKKSTSRAKITPKKINKKLKNLSNNLSSNRLFRVKLTYNDNSATITADQSFKIVNINNDVMFTLPAKKKARVRKVRNNIHVQMGNVTKSSSVVRLIPQKKGIVEIATMERRPSWNLKLNDNRFRGALEIRVINNKTTYINELAMEDYLKGIAEVSNDAPLEKQKVIAVLARTYAYFYMQAENRKFPGLPYDGSDDPAVFQRYLGYGYEIRSPQFAGALALTKDEVVTHQGKIVKTPYFNQSDGRTRSAEEVWGWKHTPYLKSVSDSYCEGMVKRGHGVGLSGYGATKMAENGMTYDDIIKYYYTGVKVEEIEY